MAWRGGGNSFEKQGTNSAREKQIKVLARINIVNADFMPKLTHNIKPINQLYRILSKISPNNVAVISIILNYVGFNQRKT